MRAASIFPSPRRFGFAAAAFLISALFALALAELALRVFQPVPSGYRALLPGLIETFHPRFQRGVEGPSRYVVNSMGVRGREWGAERSAEYRILCVGGSTTESLVTDQDRTWTALLEQRLGTLGGGRKVWVGNIGRSGLNSQHHLLQVSHLLEVYDPDLVLVLAGVNDLSRCLAGDGSCAPESPQRVHERAFMVVPGGAAGTIVWPQDPWYKRSRLWQLARRLLSARRGEDDAQSRDGASVQRWRDLRARGTRLPALPPLDQGLVAFEHNLVEIVRQIQAHGARPILLTQPTLWREGLSEAEEASLWMGGVGKFRSIPGSPYYQAEPLAAGMAAFNARTRSVCAATSVACIDLAEQIPRTAEYFYDDCHFTDEAQRRIAEVIAESLVATIGN